jgi:hypothetical protein
VWVAVAAMAVVSLARVQADLGNATLSTNPVLAFLTGHENAAALSTPAAPRTVNLGSARNASVALLHHAAPGAWTAVLPVLFVGLVAPLSLISPCSNLSLGRAPAFPGLPEKFQRPPPALL